MRKLKVGDYIKILRYSHHYEFEGKVARVVHNPAMFTVNTTIDFGEPIGRKEFKTHNAHGFDKNHYLYVTSSMDYEILVTDNPLNRILYPELTPSGKGWLE